MKFFLFHGPGVIFHILHESVWREAGGISAIVSLEDNQLPLFADKNSLMGGMSVIVRDLRLIQTFQTHHLCLSANI